MKTLRERLKDAIHEVIVYSPGAHNLIVVSEQMDALLEECGQKLKHDYWHNDIRTKLKQTGYGV